MAADVRSFGAVGDGSTDDRGAIQRAIDNSPNGGTIDFGPGQLTYLVRGTLDLKPNRTYSGAATVKMAPGTASGTTLFRLSYGQSDNVRIEGLTLDGSGVGGIINAGVRGATSIPVSNLVIDSTTLKNSKSGNPWDGCLYIPVAARNVTVDSNQFTNCGQGIMMNDPSDVVVSQNDFDGVTSGNAMFFGVFQNSSNLDITGNTGRNLRRMAVEVWGGAPNVSMDNVLISNNTFVNWTSTTNDSFGISVVVGRGAKIINNTLTNGLAGFGIEFASPNGLVEGNTITGFPVGIVIQGATDGTIKGNRLIRQTDTAILFSNVGRPVRNKILNNQIDDARISGIGSYPTDYSGSLIQGNRINRRAGAFPQDSGSNALFFGIKVDTGLTAPITIDQNKIIQTEANPPANFQFWGLGLFGKYPGSSYTKNWIESKSQAPTGSGMNLWLPGLLNQLYVTDNTFVNLSTSNNGNPPAGVIRSNNLACGVITADRNLITSVQATCASAPPPDGSSPNISGISANPITATGATIVWTTSEAADSQVEYGLTASYGLATPRNAAMVTNHNVNLSGLKPSTKYFYRVRTRDASGNEAISPGLSFTTGKDTAAPQNCNTPSVNAFTGCYYLGNDFSTLKLIRRDAQVSMDWKRGGPPTLPVDWFSIRWLGNFTFDAGTYDFQSISDDGLRLYVDNRLVIDRWVPQGATTTYKGSMALTAGVHTVKIEYFENFNDASVRVSWNKPGQAPVLNSGQSSQSLSLPLQVSSDSRGFAGQDGNPFFWLGERIDTLLTASSAADLQAYFAQIRARGASVVEATMVLNQTNADGSVTPLANADGLQPWNPDLSPNPAYFDSIKVVLNAAAAEGIIVAFTPEAGSAAADQAMLRDRAVWLGKRFQASPNLIWLAGGTSAEPVAAGLREGDAGTHLIGRYVDDAASGFVGEGDFALQVDSEGRAEFISVSKGPAPESIPSADATTAKRTTQNAAAQTADLTSGRRSAWQAYLRGESFSAKGSGQLSQMGEKAAATLKSVLSLYGWSSLNPAPELLGEDSDAAIAKSLDGDLAIVYTSRPGVLAVALDRLAAASAALATWIDPVTGDRSEPETVSAGGWQYFRTPPQLRQDAVLVLQVVP